MQNDTPITAKWSRSKPEVEFQYGGRLYFETGSSYVSRQLRYIDEIWFADKLWPSEGSDINKYETESSILRSRTPSWEMDMTSYFRSVCSDLDEIRQPDAENMQIMANWSRLKTEVEFQYGGRLYFETGNSYISAANEDIWTKFGLLIDVDLLQAVTSKNTKPEVVFSGRGRHIQKWIWCHISAVGTPILTKFGILMQNNMQITANWSRSKPEVEFQYGGCLFFENGNICI